MPTRTYSGIDLVNYTVNENLGVEVGGTSNYNETSQANGALSGIFTGASVPPDAIALTPAYVEILAELDFDAFPAIPDNAQITAVRYKVAGTTVVSALATPSTGFDGTAVGTGILAVFRGPDSSGELLSSILMLEAAVDSPGIDTPAAVNLNGAITFSTVQLFDFTGSPINRATLASMFQQLAIYLGQVPSSIVPGSNNISGGSADDVGAGATSSLSYSTVITAIQIEIDYTEGPFTITLNPSGGDVESGQQIAVSSPDIDVQTLNYAAIQNDKVIPLKISPEGNLTIPDPASDPCTDCLGDCPECDDCVTACQEDLNSEACQACLQSCLDCLGNCLESLEAAEGCQDSTQTPPAAVPITIICSDGTQFSGSVPLGNFTILLTHGSGIYRLIPGQTKDVLYSSARDGSTYDVKIPNPFAKTGFFRS